MLSWLTRVATKAMGIGVISVLFKLWKANEDSMVGNTFNFYIDRP